MPKVLIGNIKGPAGDKGDPGPPGTAADVSVIDDHIAVHAQSATPHPAYDDLPDLVLIFENGLI